MSQSDTRSTATPVATTPTSWPRPTLVVLPPLTDLTLQSGTTDGIDVGASPGTGLGFSA